MHENTRKVLILLKNRRLFRTAAGPSSAADPGTARNASTYICIPFAFQMMNSVFRNDDEFGTVLPEMHHA